MVWIKICGITTLQDAWAAEKLGADALGFLFASSERKIAPENAAKIITNLSDKTEKIGVFVNEEPHKVRKIINECGLTGVQFHGSETPAYLADFKDCTVIKALRVSDHLRKDEIEKYKDSADRMLLDTYVPGALGGTGKTFPWKIVREYDFEKLPLIIAGGITPENILHAVETAVPYGVDIGSGVEEKPGKKSIQKLIKLFTTLKLGGREYDANR